MTDQIQSTILESHFLDDFYTQKVMPQAPLLRRRLPVVWSQSAFLHLFGAPWCACSHDAAAWGHGVTVAGRTGDLLGSV